MMNPEVQSGWVEFLTRNRFKIFGNLTFDQKMGPSVCRRRVNEYIRKVAEEYSTIPYVFIAQEMQKRCQVHYHLLIDPRADIYIDPFRLKEMWPFGLSRFYPINNDFNALNYVSKYCVSDGGYYNDWWIWDASNVHEEIITPCPRALRMPRDRREVTTDE